MNNCIIYIIYIFYVLDRLIDLLGRFRLENLLDWPGCRYFIILMILGAKLTLTGEDFTSLFTILHEFPTTK